MEFFALMCKKIMIETTVEKGCKNSYLKID